MEVAAIGAILAVSGSIVSVIGTCYNNLWHRHITAMKIWAVSNALLLIWAMGLSCDWWDGGISGVSLVLMYAIFSITNAYGLFKQD